MCARDAPAGMAPDDPADDPDLRERVAELEQTVEQQQETIHQLLPSRRRVLQAGGLVAGGGVLGALSADRASADVVGQVGTSQDRVDVFAGAVDANSVKTNDATIKSSTENVLLSDRRGVSEVAVQSESGDTTGSLITYPSGTNNRSHFLVANDADANNFGGVKYEIQGTESDIEAFSKGTGTPPDQLNIRDFSNVNIEGKATVESDFTITGSSYVRATLGTVKSSLSQQTFVNPVDTENEDSRSEFDSSSQFTPDASGNYKFIIDVQTKNGTSGDLIRSRVQDITNSTTVGIEKRWVQHAPLHYAQREFVRNLTAGTTYELQITNNDSGSWEIQPTGTELVIEKHPIE